MKPYIAILIDSFWEAVGSKVLWAMLLAWSLILLALAPFGYVTERSFKLASHDVSNRSRLIEKLAKGGKGQGSTETQAIAKHLKAGFLKRVTGEAEKESTKTRISERDLATELNSVLSIQELYSEEAFPTAHRRDRLKPLTDRAGSLDAADLEELNRELLKLAFPIELKAPRSEQLYIGYAGFKITEALGISRRQIDQFVEPLILSFIIKLGLGVGAIFASLIVTSTIIPDTFKTGTLHLLLSKPISRVWLFLSKFVGGCIFVLVNIAFLLIGLYFIAGLRFGIWNSGLIGCIPLLLFVFVIFYSISALAGLLWGNPIISVVCCMMLWLFCFGIGVIYEAMRPQVELQQQVSRFMQLDDERLVAVSESGKFNVWNKEFSVWQPAIEPESRGQSRIYGPIYDEQRQVLIAKEFRFRGPFDRLQSSSRKLSVIHLDQDRSETPAATEESSEENSEASSEEALTRATARETARWMADPGPELPEQLFEMLAFEGGIIAVCRNGIHKLDLEMLDAAEATETGFLGFKLPWVGSTAFRKISPPDVYLDDNATSSVVAGGQGIILYSSHRLDLLKSENDGLVVAASHQFEEAAKDDAEPAGELLDSASDGTEAALVQMNEKFCVLARDGLPLVILSPELKVLSEVELRKGYNVRQLAWIPGTNRLAIVTHTGELLELDCDNSQVSELKTRFSGKCISMNWLDEQRVWLGVLPNRVYLLNTSTGNVETECIPAKTTLDNIFGTLVKPLYLINPKPSALDNAMTYLLSGSQTMNPNLFSSSLKTAQIELDVWQPIYSNLAFVFVVLGFSCVYVARKEY